MLTWPVSVCLCSLFISYIIDLRARAPLPSVLYIGEDRMLLEWLKSNQKKANLPVVLQKNRVDQVHRVNHEHTGPIIDHKQQLWECLEVVLPHVWCVDPDEMNQCQRCRQIEGVLPHEICHSPAVIEFDNWLDRPRKVRLVVVLCDLLLHPDFASISLRVMPR